MTFGKVKYITPLMLAVTCVSGCGGAFYSDKKCYASYDGGLETNYTQSGTTVTRNTNNAVYSITADIDGDDNSNGSATSNKDYKIEAKTFKQNSEPSSSDYALNTNDVWIDTSDNNKMYVWNGSSWVDTTTGNLKSGKTSYSDTTAGYFIGLDSGTAKMNIGDSSHSLKWSGSELLVAGEIVQKNSAGYYYYKIPINNDTKILSEGDYYVERRTYYTSYNANGTDYNRFAEEDGNILNVYGETKIVNNKVYVKFMYVQNTTDIAIMIGNDYVDSYTSVTSGNSYHFTNSNINIYFESDIIYIEQHNIVNGMSNTASPSFFYPCLSIRAKSSLISPNSTFYDVVTSVIND